MMVQRIEVFFSPTQAALLLNGKAVVTCELSDDNTLSDAFDSFSTYCRTQKILFLRTPNPKP